MPPIVPGPRLTREQWEQWQRDATELHRARKVINRSLAIRDGLVPPPWMKEAQPTEQPPKEAMDPTRWLQAAVNRRGGVPTGRAKASLARELHTEMSKAVKAGECSQLLTAKTIGNKLYSRLIL